MYIYIYIYIYLCRYVYIYIYIYIYPKTVKHDTRYYWPKQVFQDGKTVNADATTNLRWAPTRSSRPSSARTSRRTDCKVRVPW